MKIRKEKSSDYNEVSELVKISFSTNHDDDETTHDYFSQIRLKDTFIPELSLVAENNNGKIFGQIVLYKTDITTEHGKITELLLSPISVHPDYFRQGIGRAMIKESFRITKEMRFKAVFLCGEPELYKKFGFVPSYKYKIFHVTDELKNAEWSMAYELEKDALNGICGTINTV